MLESLAATILNRVIGRYVENFDPQQLNIGIWLGDVALRNLRVKRELLDKFDLPVNVLFGHVGKLTLQVPWANLKGKPVKVLVEDVYILVTPARQDSYSATDDEARQVAVKRERLEQLELLDLGRPADPSSSSQELFTQGLVTKVVDNLQVTIRNIHVRYEDRDVFTAEPYAVGMTLAELSAQLADENWLPLFIATAQAEARKAIVLDLLAAYWHTAAESIHCDNHDELLGRFKAQIAVLLDVSSAQYLLRPVLGTGHVTLRKLGATATTPHVLLELFFDEFGVDLDADQYRDMLWTLHQLVQQHRTRRFRRFRPAVTPLEDPKAWLVYAATAVHSEIHEKHRRWLWDYFKQRRDDRVEYVRLWSQWLTGNRLEEQLMRETEDRLAYDDIKFYRSLARRAVQRAAPPPPPPPKQGWVALWWSGGNKNTEEDEPLLEMTPEQRKELYDAIDYDEDDTTTAIDTPAEWTLVQLLATLNKGGVVVRPAKGLPNLAAVVFEGCSVQLQQRPLLLAATFLLHEFRVEDGTGTSLHTNVVLVTGHEDASALEPFFKVQFERNPLDGHADLVLLARMRSMTVFYNKVLVQALVRFFTPPKTHQDTVGMLMNAAESTVEGWSQMTRMGLEYALEEHRTLDAKLDLQTPLVIVPLDALRWDLPAVLVDAGHILLVLDLVLPETLAEVRLRELALYTQQDWERLTDLMYDRFHLHLQDAQVLAGLLLKDVVAQLNAGHDRPALIIDRLNWTVQLDLLILPGAVQLPRVRVSANVPRVRCGISDVQYKTVMLVIDVVLDSLDGEAPSTGTLSSTPLLFGDVDGEISSVDLVNKEQGDAHQHLFELRFTVGEVLATLSQVDDGAPLPLIDLHGGNFSLTLIRQQDTMTADVTLKTLSVRDRMDAALPWLMQPNADPETDLLAVKYRRLRRTAQLGTHLVEVWDQTVGLAVAHVLVVAARQLLLQLLHFVLDTFTDPNPPEQPADVLRHQETQTQRLQPATIDVSVELAALTVALYDDGELFARLEFLEGSTSVHLLPDLMQVAGRLGGLVLCDLLDESLPQLLSIDGDQVAEFAYETFDPDTNRALHTAKFLLRANSARVHVVEQCMARLMVYLRRFALLKAVYDRARAVRTAQVELPLRMLLDVLVRSPVVVVPRGADELVLHLGEVKTTNGWSELEDGWVNALATTVSNARVSTELHFGDVVQLAPVVEDVDVDVNIEMSDSGTTVAAQIGNTKCQLADTQLAYLQYVADVLLEVVADREEPEDVEAGATGSGRTVVSVKLPLVSLLLFDHTVGVEDITTHPLATFLLHDTALRYTAESTGHWSAEFHLYAFSATDSRGGSNQFPEIMPRATHDGHQVMAQARTEGSNKRVVATVTVDLPKVILALDWVFALQAYAATWGGIGGAAEPAAAAAAATALPATPLAYTLDVVEPLVVLVADPTLLTSEALVFKLARLLVLSQQQLSVSASNIGLFVCRMDRFDERLRIIDDFGVQLALTNSTSDLQMIQHVEMLVDPLVMRVLLRDIRLSLRSFQQALAAVPASSSSGASPEPYVRKRQVLSSYTLLILSGTVPTAEVVVRQQTCSVLVAGLRTVLIGDVHELPVLDCLVEPFEIKAADWLAALLADTKWVLRCNVFNYANSCWEPMVEPWTLVVHALRPLATGPIQVDLVLRDTVETTVLARLLALLLQIYDLVLLSAEFKSRDDDKPYRIVNETGCDCELVAHDGTVHAVAAGDTLPFEFEDWREVREMLDTDNRKGVLSVRVAGYDEVEHVPMTGEGEMVYLLTPPSQGVHLRLVVEVTLGEDKIKTVLLRSGLVVDNATSDPLIAGVAFANGTPTVEIRIPAGESRLMPIATAYSEPVAIRPDTSTAAFGWLENKVFWQHMLKEPVYLRCAGVSDRTLFYLQAVAHYDQQEPLAQIYPHMRVVVSAPLEIENLLPYPVLYRLYDKNTKRDWKEELQSGERKPIHMVRLEHLLLLSIQPTGTGFGNLEFAVVSAPESSRFKRELVLTMRHRTGQRLQVKIAYSSHHHRTGVRMSLFSPVVVLNETGLPVSVAEANGTNPVEIGVVDGVLRPAMFLFELDLNSVRAAIRVDASLWSKPVSFSSIGSTKELQVARVRELNEIHVGVRVEEGTGVYKLLRVVTIAPRYVIRNSCGRDVYISEVGGSVRTRFADDLSTPLYTLRKGNKRVQFGFGSELPFSAPVAINDVGAVHVKVSDGKRHMLLKVTIVLEGLTLFVHVDDGGDLWPFAIRNYSNAELVFFQSDPNVDDNDEVVVKDMPFTPIYYRVPARLVMPYAWDYPSGIVKEVVIRAHGRERHVALAEIGNSQPMVLPETENEPAMTIDFDVVADGAVQALEIRPYDPQRLVYKRQVGDQFELQEDLEIEFQVVVRFSTLGVSLLNHRSQELCYLTVRGAELRYSELKLYQTVAAKIRWIQLDNQLYGGVYPILIYPLVLPKLAPEVEQHPALLALASRLKDLLHGVLYIKYATILMQAMTVEVDEDFVYAAMEFVNHAGKAFGTPTPDRLCPLQLSVPQAPALSFTELLDLYFELLHLQPTQLDILFVRTEHVNAEEVATDDLPGAILFNMLTMTIGSIEDAPIKLNLLMISNVRVPTRVLAAAVQTHYSQAFLGQLHKVLGLADFIGNPVGLWANLLLGVADVFYEPYRGLVMNDRPQEIGIGVAKGGLLLMKKLVFGILDLVAKVTGSFAKGLSIATFDKQYQERRRINKRRNRPKHALSGFARGASSFVEGVSSGVSGIALLPLEGAAQDGALGLFRGIGKGLIGLPTKTAIGVMDLALNVLEGIRNTTTIWDGEGLDRVRLPRYIAPDGVVRPYRFREAQGQGWLKTVNGGEFSGDRYLAHVVLQGEQMAVVVLYERIMLVEVAKETTVWSVAYLKIRLVSVESTGIQLGIARGRGPFIPVATAEERRFLYEQIGVAVGQWNKREGIEL